MKARYFFLAAAFALGIAVLASGCGETESKEDPVQWLSIEEGLEAARQQEKHIVIDFYTSWCKWCEVMDEQTFSHRDVSEYLKDNFICVRVNAEDKKNRFNYKRQRFSPFELAREFGVRGYPSLAYLKSDGDLIGVVPGFVPPDKYMRILEYFNEELYTKNVDLKKFMDSKRS